MLTLIIAIGILAYTIVLLSSVINREFYNFETKLFELRKWEGKSDALLSNANNILIEQFLVTLDKEQY